MRRRVSMKLGTTYICVDGMEKSLYFYRNFLRQDPLYCNDDRWASFTCGISLYNKKYDEKLIENGGEIHFNQAYLNDLKKAEPFQRNNRVIFNFITDDLGKEYKRLKDLFAGMVSEIFYVNVHRPYYYFNVADPDGNVLEVTGNYV